MQYVRAVDVLEATKDLVGEVAHMVIAEVLCLQELVKVCLHQCLHNVHRLEFLHGRRPKYVEDGYYLVGGREGGGAG